MKPDQYNQRVAAAVAAKDGADLSRLLDELGRPLTEAAIADAVKEGLIAESENGTHRITREGRELADSRIFL
jgi:hypothetical protein